MLLAAPSPALRAGLRSLLASDPGIRVVEERSRWDAAEEGDSSEADVVVATSASVVFGSGEPDGLPSLPVLFLADEALNLPASAASPVIWGILPMESSAGDLCAAVRALSQGLVVGAPHLLFAGRRAAADGGPLTERETEVLEWLARGLANKQIAAQLGISEHTVKFHITSIYAKLQASNRTQAVREGLRNGWILL